MEKLIVGVFDHPDDVRPVIDEIKQLGVSESQIEIRDQRGAIELKGEEQKGGFAGFRGWLADLGLADRDSDHYAEAVRRGGTLVSVHTSDEFGQIDQISEVMVRHGAIDIDRRGEYYRSSGFDRFDESSQPYNSEEIIAERERFAPGGQFAIPVVEEEVTVGKRKIPEGRVRIVSRVTERPVEEDVKLRDEHYEVERRAVDRPVSAEDIEALKDEVMEFSESREEAVVEKEARVKEEVLVRKDVEERKERVRETARRTDVEVQRDK
jgi:stress response protein YsnF